MQIIWPVNAYKACSNSFIIKEIQIKTKMYFLIYQAGTDEKRFEIV